MKIANAFAILLIALAHAYAFLYAWAYIGANASSAVLSITGSFLCAVIAASLVSAAIATPPLSLLSGYVVGKRYASATIILLLAAWIGMVIHGLGLDATLRPPTVWSLLTELAFIAIFGFLSFQIGARAPTRSTAA